MRNRLVAASESTADAIVDSDGDGAGTLAAWGFNFDGPDPARISGRNTDESGAGSPSRSSCSDRCQLERGGVAHPSICWMAFTAIGAINMNVWTRLKLAEGATVGLAEQAMS